MLIHSEFAVGDRVRYRPVAGHSYQDAIVDGRVPGVVIGYTETRVQVRLVFRNGRTITRAIYPKNLEKVVDTRARDAVAALTAIDDWYASVCAAIIGA
jgi:hypothetical protein